MNDSKPEALHDEVLGQLQQLTLRADQPVVVSDGDEVIFAFVAALEDFLRGKGCYLRLDSFALTGNIRYQADDNVVDGPAVKQLIGDFFASRTENIPLISGAKAAVIELLRHCQFIVLSNIPLGQRDARRQALVNAGLDLPVIANIGRKGPAMRWIASRTTQPIFFLDDIPHNIESVAKEAPEVCNIHFIGDERLAKLIGRSPSAIARIDDWPTAVEFIKTKISATALENSPAEIGTEIE